MLITAKQLIGLNVLTRSGRQLGHVKDLEINAETGQIENYLVAGSGLADKFLASELVIAKSQVIEINVKAVIVEDNLTEGAKLAEASV